MNYIKKAIHFLEHDLWRTSGDELPRIRRFAYGILKTIILSLKGFTGNDITMRANSLTYSLMFAIVPILAFIVAIAKGFGFETAIEDYLNQSFLSNYNIVPTIMGFVQRYLETAQGGLFLGIGIFILLWAVYSFFQNVENSFNKIWEVNNSRSIVRQMTNYITILIIVPVLIIASSGINIFVNSNIVGDSLFSKTAPFYAALLKCVPWLTTWLIFFLMYKMIPNTKVRIKSALIPGVVIGTLVQLLQLASVYIIMFLGRTSIVYGTFAAIPLLLTWVQWTCLLILSGAELSYAIQNNEHYDFLRDTNLMSRRYKDYLTLYICYIIIKRFENAQEPQTAKMIARHTKLPVRLVNQLVSRMVSVQLITEIRSDNDDESNTYQPALDINRITVGLVFERINKHGAEKFFRNLPQEMNVFWDKWIDLQKQGVDTYNILVKDL